ncbi:MAG: hypothetical protein IGS48_19405 [Oscillatoriales cyanobacterium C42_A2020_001]|nr:hypothetical protein [Leptolyngbyaceae cyanobacterium C42_A2020_001]
MGNNIRELIDAQIDKVGDNNLDELYVTIKQFVQVKVASQPNVLVRLKQIKIQAPEDFAQNLDQYLYNQSY